MKFKSLLFWNQLLREVQRCDFWMEISLVWSWEFARHRRFPHELCDTMTWELSEGRATVRFQNVIINYVV